MFVYLYKKQWKFEKAERFLERKNFLHLFCNFEYQYEFMNVLKLLKLFFLITSFYSFLPFYILAIFNII